MGYVEYDKTVQPRWQSGRMGEGWTEAHSIIRDVIADSTRYAVAARFITDVADDGLPFSASERSLEKMPGESSDSWRARIIDAWNAWIWAGTDKGVVDNIKLTGLTNVVLHDYWSWPDGNDAAWARFWLEIDQPHPWTAAKAVGSGWTIGDGTLVGIGNATEDQILRLKRQVATWKASHASCESVIVVFSGALVGGGWLVGDGTTVGGDSIGIPVP